MDQTWESEFRERMRSFELTRPPRKHEVSISLKVRVISGCFHRQHSPHAYALICKHLASIDPAKSEFAFVEHESGPELLVYLALATAGVTLAKSVIDLIIAIITARAKGIKNGDRPDEPIEIIIRRVGEGDKFVEEKILRIGPSDPVNREQIDTQINAALKRIAGKGGTKTAIPRIKATRHKRRAP